MPKSFYSQAQSLSLTAGPEESWPFYDEDEVKAAADVLRSGKVNQWTGHNVFAFEEAYDRHLGCGRAIALGNGSLALELALRAFGIGQGDEVIVTPRSFVASAFCVMLVGATPVFVEIDRDSGNMTPEGIERAITSRTKAIIPVHLGGWPADMSRIMALARAHGLKVIEDCAQAHGAAIGRAPVGSFGDAAAFSFCQDKIISTGGEGGLVVFQDEAAYEWAWSYKDHGKNPRKIVRGAPVGPGFRWLHDMMGTNWRMLELSAAIGLLQLGKLERWRDLRERNARIWAEALSTVPGLRLPLPEEGLTGAFYKFYAYLDRKEPERETLRNEIITRASELGVRVLSGSCSEVYREEAFADRRIERLPQAQELGETSLMFEVHPTLDPERLKKRAEIVAEIAHSVLRD